MDFAGYDFSKQVFAIVDGILNVWCNFQKDTI